ncbi:hypothetical protein T484DRAFT_1803059, partial [Baffinella frigidus]
MLVSTLYMDDECKKHLRLDSVLTVVDCKHLGQQLDQKGGAHGFNEAAEQAREKIGFANTVILNKTDLIGFADVVILNKTDLVSLEEVAAVRQRVQ